MKFSLSVMGLFVTMMILAPSVVCSPDVYADIRNAESLLVDSQDMASEAFTNTLSNNPNFEIECPEGFVRVHLGLASIYEGHGKYQEAIGAIRKALAVGCQDMSVIVELRSRLAFNYRMAGDRVSSARELDALIRDYPQYAKAWQTDLAADYEYQCKYLEAIAVLDKIGDTCREDRCYALYFKSRMLISQIMDYEKGISVAETFLDDYSDSAYARDVTDMLVLALKKTGRQQEADTLSKSEYPGLSDARNSECRLIESMLYTQQQPVQAREACEKLRDSLTYTGDRTKIAYLLACCIYAEGNWSAARDAFQSLYDHLPVGCYHAQSKYYTADCYIRLGDVEGGRKVFWEVVDMFPGTKWAEVAAIRLFSDKEVASPQ